MVSEPVQLVLVRDLIEICGGPPASFSASSSSSLKNAGELMDTLKDGRKVSEGLPGTDAADGA